jgi:hypothetical protein
LGLNGNIYFPMEHKKDLQQSELKAAAGIANKILKAAVV